MISGGMRFMGSFSSTTVKCNYIILRHSVLFIFHSIDFPKNVRCLLAKLLFWLVIVGIERVHTSSNLGDTKLSSPFINENSYTGK